MGVMLITAALAACQKEGSVEKPPASSSMQLAELRSGSDFIRFDYGTDNKVSKITVSEDPLSGEPDVSFNVTYRSDGKPDQLTGSNNTVIRTTYNNGLLTRADMFISTQQITKTDYVYAGTALKTITGHLFDGTDPVPFFKADLTMSGSGNVSKTNVYLFDPFKLDVVPAGHVNQQYDDKPNPLAVLNDFMLIFWQQASKNNVIREDHFDENGQAQEVIEYTYTYNSKGYPAKAAVKETAPGQQPVNSEVVYTYR